LYDHLSTYLGTCCVSIEKIVIMISINSIKKKILIFAILATLIPSTGLGLLSFWQNEAMIADNVTHQLRTLAVDSSRELEYWYEERVDELRTLSASDAVINGLPHRPSPVSANTTQNHQVLPHYLRLVQEKLNPLLQLTVFDASGQVVASSGVTPAPVMLPDPWPQTASTNGVIIDTPRWDETHATTTLTLAVPVLSLGNEIMGALVAIVDMGTVLPSLIYATTLSPGNVVLLDLAGNPLLGTYNLNATYIPLETEALQRLRADAGEPITFEGHLQQTVLGLVMMPQSLPVIVVAERARADIYLAWIAFRNLFLSLMGGLTLLVVFVAWRMGRSIVTPLERLTGAADHIAAGDLTIQLPVVQRDELGRLTEVFNQMTENLRRSHDEFEAASQTLQKQNKLLETLSITDSLTGLYNRKKLDDILADQLARFKRNQRSFAVLLLDIDHFKRLNDTYGHLAGDQVLTSVARTFSSSIRNIDFAARYGGEEFVIVLPETAISAAREMAERIRQQVRGASYQFNDQSIAVTLSIGVADSRSGDETADAVLARADNMLYEAKRTGRNRVHCTT